MSEYDTITDLATEINTLKQEIETITNRAAMTEEAHRLSNDELTKAYNRQYTATLRFQEYMGKLRDTFGDAEVAECLGIPIKRDYRIAVPIHTTVYVTVTATSEEEAITRVQNGEMETELRYATAYTSAYDYEYRLDDALMESIAYVHPLAVPLFNEQ